MSYCTTTDVYLETGTSLGTIQINDISSMIQRSDAEISDMLTIRGVSVPTTSTLLKTASIALTIAKIKRRQAQELSRPNSLSIGSDISFSVSIETEITALETRANTAINQYIGSVNGFIRVRSTTGGR